MLRWLFLLGVAATACGGGGGGDDVGDDVPPVAEAPRGYDAVAYALRAEFDWTTRRLSAVEDITLALADPAAATIELDTKVEVTRVFAGTRELVWRSDVGARTLRVELAPIAAPGPITFSVAYTATAATSLIASTGQRGDPITSRVVYTDSEPDRGVAWLVANHRPADRATFAVEITVPAGEDVIANGERVRDETVAGSRVIGYAIDQPIPTYIMAFAAGELAHHDRAGRVPLSLWHRRGLLVDAPAHLDLLADQLAALEPLVGPYPWRRYAVVLLPEFPAGGMENATVTFNSEPVGQGHISSATNAHELAHQWFGDWMTMRRFDDAWVKEGMATLLQWEAGRARDDTAATGRLFGNFLSFDAQDAIVDTALVGTSKYTSGIYDRAAWLITQIRARVGEEAFWRSLRAILAAHALGSIDGESFVRGFAPALDEAAITQILASLPSKQPPTLVVDVEQNGGDRIATLTLRDPAGAVIAPMVITVVDGGGVATEHTLAAGVASRITVPAGGYLAPDERGVHTTPGDGILIEGNKSALFQLYMPTSAAALAAFGQRSPVHQERELERWVLPVDFDGLSGFYAVLDSMTARRAAQSAACQNVAFVVGQGNDPAPWVAALAPIVTAPALPLYDTAHAACGTALATSALGAEITGMVDAITAGNAERFLYLLGFDYGVDASLTVISKAVTGAPSLQIRSRALDRLAAQAEGRYTVIPEAALPAWRALFRTQLTAAQSAPWFFLAWRGVLALDDEPALATAARQLRAVTFTASQQRSVVCNAYELTQRVRPDAWAEFTTAVAPVSTLAPAAAAAIADPLLCTTSLVQPVAASPSEVLRGPDRPR